MPLICRAMVEVLDSGNISSQNQSSLSNYAFLYGVFPTAPSVAIYASHYNMELQVVSACVCIWYFEERERENEFFFFCLLLG